MKYFLGFILFLIIPNLFAQEVEYRSPGQSYKLEIFPTSIRYSTINRTIEIQRIHCLNKTLSAFTGAFQKELRTKVIHSKSDYILKNIDGTHKLMKGSRLQIFLSRMKNMIAEIQLKSRINCD